MQGDMLMRPFTALLCIGLWCMQPEALAAEPQPAQIDRPCIEGSPEFVDVAQKLAALDGQIRTLKPDSDHRPANEALMALMRHQCMALANVDMNALHAEAAPALTEFWEGGWPAVGRKRAHAGQAPEAGSAAIDAQGRRQGDPP